MKIVYTPEQFKRNNSSNDFITVQSMLSAILSVDFASQTDEQFAKYLDTVPKINELLIDRSKCDSDEDYRRALLLANICLSKAMIEKRIGVSEHKE